MEEAVEIKEEIEISDVELDDIGISDDELEESNDVDVVEITSEKKEKRDTEEGEFTAFDVDGNWCRINTSIIPNPLTSAKAEVEIAPDKRFYEALLRFKKGYTMFSLIMHWGLIDQKCLTLWRLMRLMSFLNMLQPFGTNWLYIGSVTIKIVKILKEIKREYTLMRTRYRIYLSERRKAMKERRRAPEIRRDEEQKYRFIVMREEKRIKNPFVIKK